MTTIDDNVFDVNTVKTNYAFITLTTISFWANPIQIGYLIRKIRNDFASGSIPIFQRFLSLIISFLSFQSKCVGVALEQCKCSLHTGLCLVFFFPSILLLVFCSRWSFARLRIAIVTVASFSCKKSMIYLDE